MHFSKSLQGNKWAVTMRHVSIESTLFFFLTKDFFSRNNSGKRLAMSTPLFSYSYTPGCYSDRLSAKLSNPLLMQLEISLVLWKLSEQAPGKSTVKEIHKGFPTMETLHILGNFVKCYFVYSFRSNLHNKSSFWRSSFKKEVQWYFVSIFLNVSLLCNLILFLHRKLLT